MEIPEMIKITDPALAAVLAGALIAIVSGIVRGIAIAKESEKLRITFVVLAVIGRTLILVGFVALWFMFIDKSESSEMLTSAIKTAVCGFAVAITGGHFKAIASIANEDSREGLEKAGETTKKIGMGIVVGGIVFALAKMIIK